MALPTGSGPVGVVDLCAAPGGKLLHLAERLGERAHLVALDRHAGRLGRVVEHARRLGVQPRLASQALDCTDLAAVRGAVAAALPAGCRPQIVLVDAPCTGLGTGRRHPEAMGRPPPSPQLLQLQARLLQVAAGLLEDGGGLLWYAVCTITRAEGPQQVQRLRRAYPQLQPLPVPEALRFGETHDGWQSWTDRDGADSFFAACLAHPGGRAEGAEGPSASF